MKRNKTGVGDPPPNADQNETENKYKDKPRKRDDLIRIEFKKSTFLKLSFLSLLFLIGVTLYFGFKEKLFNFTFEYNHGMITPDVLVLFDLYDKDNNKKLDLHEFEPLAYRVFNAHVRIYNLKKMLLRFCFMLALKLG